MFPRVLLKINRLAKHAHKINPKVIVNFKRRFCLARPV